VQVAGAISCSANRSASRRCRFRARRASFAAAGEGAWPHIHHQQMIPLLKTRDVIFRLCSRAIKRDLLTCVYSVLKDTVRYDTIHIETQRVFGEQFQLKSNLMAHRQKILADEKSQHSSSDPNIL